MICLHLYWLWVGHFQFLFSDLRFVDNRSKAKVGHLGSFSLGCLSMDL